MSEGKNSTGRNLDFLAILWISADSLRFFAQNECAEARNFYIFPLGQRTAHMVEYGFDHLRGLRTGQAYCPIQRFSQIGTRQRLRSEEHTSELQSLMRISYAVFCLKKKTNTNTDTKYDNK